MIVQILGAGLLVLALGVVLHYSRIYGVDRIVFFLGFVLTVMLAIVAFPYLFQDKINLGFMRPLDAFLSLTSVSALLLCLALYFRLRKTERDLTVLVREKALENQSNSRQ